MALDFLTGDREQQFLLPPDMREWLPEDHLVWCLLDVVARLDLSAFERRSDDLRGRRAYDPAVLVAVLVYAYCVGERSSRRIERRCHEDVAFRVAAANLAPDHTTLSRFVKEHAEAFDSLFVQVLAMAAAAGLGRVGNVFVDGTKVAADASSLQGRTREQLEAEVRRITEEARETDALEDERFGEARGDELPEELVDPTSRRARLDAALQELEDIERRRRPYSKAKKPPRANVTDPEARTVKGPRGFFFGYNAQAVASEDGLVVAADVTQDTVDNAQFVPMVDQAGENLEAADVGPPRQAVADNGYWSGDNATSHLPDNERDSKARRRRPTPLIVPSRDQRRSKIATRGPIPNHATPAQVMERMLRTKRGRATYKKRARTIEPIFGMIKGARGFTRFQRRGLKAARQEWRFIATTHNIMKMWRHTKALRLATA